MLSRLLIVVTLAVVAIGLAAFNRTPATRASYPGESGRIAFAVPDGPARHIWTMEPDGSDRRQITTGAVTDFGPRWSRDGTKIAFRRNSPTGGIYTVDADGQDLHFVPATDNGFGPTWSPDGQRIAFGDETTQDILTIGINGDDPTNLTNSEDAAEFDPDWSPNGQRISFTRQSQRDGTDLWTMDTQGLHRQQLTSTPEEAESPSDWSPDNQRIVFTVFPPNDDSADIGLVAATGGTVEMLTNSTDAESWPVFSPDGTQVAFAYSFEIPVSGPSPFSNTIAIMDLSNHALHNITLTDPALDDTPDWAIVPGTEPDLHLWGDNNCSGEIDEDDAILTLRFLDDIEGGANADCPTMGEVGIPGPGPYPWGSVDCSIEVDAPDILPILSYLAGLGGQQDGCPDIGELVDYSARP